MLKILSLYTSVIIFWLSLIGTVIIGISPKIRNYVIPGKQTMSFWQAGTIMFTGLYSSSVLYWSFFENILFKDDPFFIALFPDKVGNNPFLTAITLYNWVLPLYIILFLAIIICIFISIFRDKYLSPKYKKILKITSITLMIFSTTRIMTSLASYIIPLRFILNSFSGIDNNILLVSLLLGVSFWSASGGLHHIKKLANICAIIILLYTIIFVTKMFMLSDGLTYVYNSIKEFSQLVINTDFIKAQFSFNNTFVADWTILFSTIQIVCTFPALYFFYITMQGRTVKELIWLYNLFVILPTFIVFMINNSLVHILAQENNMALTPSNYFDMYQVIFDYIGMGDFTAIILFLSMFTLIVTSLDSIILACAKYLNIPVLEDEHHHIYSKQYILFTLIYLVGLGGFLLYVLYAKSKPIIAVRLYELNFIASVAIFVPLLFMIYKLMQHFSAKNSDTNKNIEVSEDR